MTTDRHPKVRTPRRLTFEGLVIYGELKVAKKIGKDRILIQIRQTDPKQYHIAQCLSYGRGIDIVFEDESTPQQRKKDLERFGQPVRRRPRLRPK